jgi:hypothetical protein
MPLKLVYFLFVLKVFNSVFAEDPVVPQLVREGIGDDYINVSFVPGDYRPDDPRPVGNSFFVRYRPEGDDDWHVSNF